jgi:formylglycine-generating enzyme required for sulfatase activity
VLDLAGNVTEWTDTVAGDPASGFRVVRGGDWSWTTAANLLEFVLVRNQRPALTRDFAVGVRCAYAD